jgi:hypothetical protein
MPLPGPPAENDPPPPMSIFKTCKKCVKSVTKRIKIQAKEGKCDVGNWVFSKSWEFFRNFWGFWGEFLGNFLEISSE